MIKDWKKFNENQKSFLELKGILPNKFSLSYLKDEDNEHIKYIQYEEIGGKDSLYYEFRYYNENLHKFSFKFFPKSIKINNVKANIVKDIHIQDEKGTIGYEYIYDWRFLNVILDNMDEDGIIINEINNEENKYRL